ncbi:MAG: MMPL family transporter [Flavobacteriaceae bacterium]|uniref:MMPL family transporter n=1 Tax=Flavobacterium kayseriense TaxID=2764714 RepID=A0ABR7J455_9FLAO|nr:efflux RND transporter permease subunit [Flavobacterium kayseriense]MBC5840242.1 MMPL family transporter [Flavobacterium kayseriense]MBC5847088.1 MMPL family transporter [Flavobacterium kayseriense]MBX9888057.1 MMPL family transporter [Flavobacteriaceae bacterium]
MKNKLKVGFWELVARIVLKNRIFILGVILLITIFLSTQWKNIRFSFTEASLLPETSSITKGYNTFLSKFGEEGNLIIVGVKDDRFFTPKSFAAWTKLMNELKAQKEVDLVVSINDLKKLEKNESLEKFDLVPFVDQSKTGNQGYLNTIKKNLFTNMPFYEGLLFNKKGSIRSAIYLDRKIVNTPQRKDYIFKEFIPKIEAFEKETGIDLKVSGMPYIRTLNANSITGEISLFIGASLLVTSLIFFFFFRSFRATLISILIVVVGVMWTFGLLGLFHFEITVLTALVPTLVIVIGIPNCIFLTNKYQQEYSAHGNKAKALQRVITKVGTATLMTNLTTAAGFATFIITSSDILREFGIVSSLSIVALFFLCLIVIPIYYSFQPVPQAKHLEHLNRNYTKTFITWIEKTVKYNRRYVYVVAIFLFLVSTIGAFKIKTSGNLIEDMPKNTGFYKDILFFENEFNGVMPLEIMVDTQRKKGVMKLSTLRKMDDLQTTIEEIPELSKPISILNLVKYSKQAYYNGNPDYYDLPTSQEQSFILGYAKNATKDTKNNIMKSYVDSTGQVARITTFMKDIGTGNMAKIEEKLGSKIDSIFPKDRYKVVMTGKALIFEKGTQYLLNNLVSSLLFAVLLISLLMVFMFRSFKMVVVSLIPNLLPLMITAGLMGYFGIPLKPSTILVFSIAFGLSVDDTIHFLAQYRQELSNNDWKIKKSVFATIKESGISMFYTSVVLFTGFSVFMLSDFGGTIALGGLIAITLAFGMLSNLMLLPCLVLTLNKSLANKQEFKEPTIDVLSKPEEIEKDQKK